MALSTPVNARREPVTRTVDQAPAVPPESALVMAAKSGDQGAFGELVGQYAGAARRLARSVLGNGFDADDAAQDAFLLAWRHIGSFDTRRPFRPWLMRIVANAATDVYRRRKVRHAGTLPETVATGEAGPDRQTDRALLRDRLTVALEGLTERQRIAVTMYDAEGYSHAEIAETLEVPVGTVRSLVFHARRALRNTLAPLEGDLP